MASSLRSPGVIPYIVGRLLQELGHSMFSVALGWQLYERTGSAFLLGMVGLVQVVPVVGLVTIAGSTADRHPRKSVGAASQLLAGSACLGIAGVSFMHWPLWIIFALLFFRGVATAFSQPSISAIMPELVTRDHLVEVNAWSSTSWQLAAMAGPAVAGILLAVVGATPLFVAGAAMYFLLAVIVWGLPTRSIMPDTPAPTRRDLLAGLRFVFRSHELLAAITLDLFAVLLGGVSAIMPIFAKDILRVGPRGLGWLVAAPPMGAFLTAMIQTRLPPWRRSGRVLLLSVAGFGAATLGFALSRSFYLSLGLLFLTGVFDSLSVVIRRTLEMVLTPDRLRGRVGAVHFVFIGLSNELGEFESGVTAALFGAVGSALLGGIGTLVVVGIAAASWPAIRRMGALVDMQAREDLARDVLGESADPSA